MERLTIRIDGEAYIEKVANKYCEEVCSSRNRCNDCPIRDAFNKLAHYEDLEERIEKLFDGKISLNEAVEEIEKKVHGEEVFRYSRILTNAEAEKWDKWLDLEEQGRLIEIIRCKDCKFFDNTDYSDDCGWCDCWGISVIEDEYCDQAKLKELKEGAE